MRAEAPGPSAEDVITRKARVEMIAGGGRDEEAGTSGGILIPRLSEAGG